MYTVSERDMMATMINYFEQKKDNELVAILKQSSFEYDPQYEFSRVISNQKKLYGRIHVPINHVSYMESRINDLSEISIKIYLDDNNYRYYGISEIAIEAVQTELLSYNDTNIVIEKDSVFSSFMEFLLSNQNIGKTHKDYLFEACECGNRNNLLAASVMLGASAELLLIQMTEAYAKYIEKEKGTTEFDSYERIVLKAKCASIRLNEFLKRAKSNSTFFKNHGFENVDLDFAFLDIIRKVRNESGHPSGEHVSSQDLKTLLANYQHLLPKILGFIDDLNTQYQEASKWN